MLPFESKLPVTVLGSTIALFKGILLFSIVVTLKPVACKLEFLVHVK